ncbi:MAG: MupA/Atu3671 family FMN-dependent luciferase-like monooxygenase, partial [Rhizobiaceae bacterium]
SLTIACAAELLARSHEIVGLVTDASPVRTWAAENNVSVLGREQLSELAPFDYLLSIANLRVLTGDELALPAKAAINFHDGPLPDISGVNNPSWAVLRGLGKYGVTWHEMVSDIDRGNIVASEQFELEADETSVSLNTKCFHAGFQSFQNLLDHVEAGSLQRTAQSDTAGLYYPRWNRPKAACSLLWNSGAKYVDGLVRSLDFGPYENPMGLPKIRLPIGLAAVGKVAVLPDRSVKAPGTIVEIANNWARIATTTQDVRISKLWGLAGAPIPIAGDRIKLASDCELVPGDVLPSLVDREVDELDNKVRRSARDESQWVERLEAFSLLDLPQSTSDEVFEESVAMPAALREPAAALAAVAAHLGRRFRSDHVDIWIHPNEDKNQSLDDFFLGCVPFGMRPDWESTVGDLATSIRHDLEATLKLAPPLIDIGLRHPSLQAKLEEIAELPSCEFSLRRDSRQRGPRPGARRLMFAMSETEGALSISATGIFEPDTFASFVERFRIMLENFNDDPAHSIAACPNLTKDDQDLLTRINDTQSSFDVQTVHASFRQQAQATPDRNAVICGSKQLTYLELDQQSDQVAIALSANGVAAGDFVGVMMGRGAELLAVLMGVIKAGAAYVPLDRNYPPNRLQFMIGDCRPKMVVVDHVPTWSSDAVQVTQCADLLGNPRHDVALPPTGEPSDLMYLIYTSGTTGEPKGVQVRHDNVQNFFVGIDERVGPDAGTLLATTSMSFDISVLELFWTLCRGFTVVVHDENAGSVTTNLPGQPIGFSLFFWNVAESEALEGSPYNLVLQASQYADTNSFEAVWTPERHFGSFGGYYPNPSVISAAIAATTERVAIRAGSCVLPLHHPVRVAEEWSVVDNLSGGRVGLSMASGWSPNDFVLKPENFANAKDLMFEYIEQVRTLWSGDSVTFAGPDGAVDVKSLPRPVQQELPVWVTTAGNPETFRKAGEIGAHILTHLLGQDVDTVASNIELYREAWRAGGRPGDGHVTVMVHTFVAASEEDARRTCREPMKSYLKSALALIKD